MQLKITRTLFTKFKIKNMCLCYPGVSRNTFHGAGKHLTKNYLKLHVFFVQYVAFMTLFHSHSLYSAEYEGKMIRTNKQILIREEAAVSYSQNSPGQTEKRAKTVQRNSRSAENYIV